MIIILICFFSSGLVIANGDHQRLLTTPYYKWQSPQPIFVTKQGNSSRYKYIGKAGSPAFLEAVEMMKNRTHISALQQVLHTLELGREDLLEEVSRISERS